MSCIFECRRWRDGVPRMGYGDQAMGADTFVMPGQGGVPLDVFPGFWRAPE
jgi:hypothetical protein